MPKSLVTVIGAVAFVIGGILTRDKALEGLETLEKYIGKKDSEPTEQ
jgi:hypothetical protein